MGEINIYIADDDEDDRMFIKEAINKIVPSAMVIEARDGLDLVDQLRLITLEGKLTMILIDMNMPKLNGLETISLIKSNPDFKNVPTLMLSTSENRDLKKMAYDLGINSFIAKPTTMGEYEDIARGLKMCYVDQFLGI